MRNGGAHGANFAVLRGFNGPSILVEMGFISNASDVEKLIREENQRQIAQDVAAGIREFLSVRALGGKYEKLVTLVIWILAVLVGGIYMTFPSSNIVKDATKVENTRRY